MTELHAGQFRFISKTRGERCTPRVLLLKIALSCSRVCHSSLNVDDKLRGGLARGFGRQRRVRFRPGLGNEFGRLDVLVNNAAISNTRLRPGDSIEEYLQVDPPEQSVPRRGAPGWETNVLAS